MSNANLASANLSYANLSRSNLIKANLSNANLSQANLSDANLNRANLSQANLSDANLNLCNLAHVQFSQANLSNANLKDANLSGTSLNEANLAGASLDKVFDNETDDFHRQVSDFTNHAITLSKHDFSKEQAKLSLVLPVIKILGYNIYDPSQVLTEYSWDNANQSDSDNSVDYALFNQCQESILISVNLTSETQEKSKFLNGIASHFNALNDYVFVMTDGIVYNFFANRDLKDEHHLCSFDFLSYTATEIEMFKLFHHQEFKIEVLKSYLHNNSS